MIPPAPKGLPMCRRRFLLAALTAALAACGRSSDPAAPLAFEIERDTACALDGMLLADYPGPKAQIHYADLAEPEFHCDLAEMFAQYLNPEQVRPIRAMYVQDMGRADWDAPRGHWIAAEDAHYVVGSSRMGAMGPAIGSFAGRAAAESFARQYGGRAVRFAEVTADMVELDGGALHDRAM